MFEAALRFQAYSVSIHQTFEFLNFPPGTSHDRGDLVGEEAIDANQLWRLAQLTIDDNDNGPPADAMIQDLTRSKSYFLIMERYSSIKTIVSSRESSLSWLSQTPEWRSSSGDAELHVLTEPDEEIYPQSPSNHQKKGRYPISYVNPATADVK